MQQLISNAADSAVVGIPWSTETERDSRLTFQYQLISKVGLCTNELTLIYCYIYQLYRAEIYRESLKYGMDIPC